LPLIGPMPGVPNAFEACTFTFGIVQAGGAGKLISEWISEGETETDSWAVDPRRFTDHADTAYCTEKALEVYSHEYAIHYPGIQWPAGRGVKKGSLYDTHLGDGAEMGAYGGWERAEFFAPKGYQHKGVDSYDRQPFFDIVGQECHHVANHVGILDLPGFSRFVLSGSGAAACLDKLITNKLPAVGRISLGYFASETGKIVSEMSVARFDENHFWLIFGAGAYWHDRDLLAAAIADFPDVELKDETRDISTFLVTGPKSRDLLASVCNTNFSSDPFPWLTHQTLQIAGVTCVAIRVSFTGELGWELHIPVAETQKIYDHLREAGSAFQLKPFGMLALDSMRLEKGYRSWKGDLTSDYNMFDAGLRRWVHFSKPDFTGRTALAAVKDAPARTLVTLALEDPSDSDTGFGEAIYLSSVFNDASGANIAGLVLSAGYGHRTKKSLALAVLEAGEDASIGRSLAVEVVGRNRHAEIIGHGAVYDADNALLKG
jgi:dimethylglycine dehydrogenase